MTEDERNNIGAKPEDQGDFSMQFQNRTLFFGDNLKILERIPDELFDLIYLDPPFNSSRNYNVLFKEGQIDSSAQIHAFEDTWEWTPPTIRLFEDLQRSTNPQIAILITSLHEFIKDTPMMAYLVNMTARLIPLRRVLKSTGSLYLHCDPTASHYLRVILDTIFDPRNFHNEIIWQRTNAKGNAFKRFATNHDTILSYTKTDKAIWKAQYTTHNPKYVEDFYHFIEPETGRRYRLDNLANPNKDRPNLTYEFPPGSGTVRVWRWTKERMMKAWEEGLVIMDAIPNIV